MTTLLLTGAAGDVSGYLRPMLRDRYDRIVLSDRTGIADLADNETFRGGDVADAGAMAAACDGVDGVIHLGGQPEEADWATVNASNIQGTATVIEAARQAGVKRFVFASSNHAVGMYPRHRHIGTDAAVRPDSFYGVSKAFGEALCSLYADKHGMRCLSIRIGNVALRPADERRLAIWLHPEDLFQLVRIGLEHPDLHNAIVYGASDNARAWWDNESAFRLGYRPAHKAEDHAARALDEQKALPADPLSDRMQGGGFCADGFDGDMERTLWS